MLSIYILLLSIYILLLSIYKYSIVIYLYSIILLSIYILLLSVYLMRYRPINLFSQLFTNLCVYCITIHPSICLFIDICFHPSINLTRFLKLMFYQSYVLSTKCDELTIYLSIHLLIDLSILVSIYISIYPRFLQLMCCTESELKAVQRFAITLIKLINYIIALNNTTTTWFINNVV